MSKDRDPVKMTAEDAYVREYLKAQDLLAVIEEYLQDLPAPQTSSIPTGVTWVISKRSTIGCRRSSTL